MTSTPLSTFEKNYTMWMHLSVFASFLIPIAGLIAPFIMWTLKKDQSPFIDKNGREITNFILNMFLWILLSGILSFIVIGIFGFFVITLYCIITPIIAAIKSQDGIVFTYPFMIRLIKS